MRSPSLHRWCLAALALLAACEPASMPTALPASPAPSAHAVRVVLLPSTSGVPLAVALLDPAGDGRPTRAVFHEAGVPTLALDLSWRREGGRWVPRARLDRGRAASPLTPVTWAASFDTEPNPCIEETIRVMQAYVTLASWCSLGEFACLAGQDLLRLRVAEWQQCTYNAV